VCVVKAGKIILDQWSSTTQSAINPNAGQYSADMSRFRNGNYTWWMRAWSPDGMGPWSKGMPFSLP
jgi:hypothetical protein